MKKIILCIRAEEVSEKLRMKNTGTDKCAKCGHMVLLAESSLRAAVNTGFDADEFELNCSECVELRDDDVVLPLTKEQVSDIEESLG